MTVGYDLNYEVWTECLTCHQRFYGVSIRDARELVVLHIVSAHGEEAP